MSSLRGARNSLRTYLTLQNRFRCLPITSLSSSKSNAFIINRNAINFHTTIKRYKNDKIDLESVIIPLPVKETKNPDDINVGEELSGSKLMKNDLTRVLNLFITRVPIKNLCQENGINLKLFNEVFISFRKFCHDSKVLPAELHIIFSDILQDRGHVDDLFPYFLKHARLMYPHLECMDELKKISDLRLPPNWYLEARSMNRKFVYHCGPTNSGKTYHALQRFMEAKSGVYCGPLKLLAVEVHDKTNEAGTDCDLVTGEERRFAKGDGTPSQHVACTVEMSSVNTPCEVAIIDEIQMIRDKDRGWAWTRALLGIPAQEIHLCGEESALDLVRELLDSTAEELEVRKYKRLTSLTIQDKALGSLDNIKAGDCIVCFSKKDIYSVSLQLEKKGHDFAVIYGTLPPGTKISQTKKFNDPKDKCKIMVATDAIGMGLNLSVRRIIFYSLMKPTVNEKGEKEMDLISTSQALQIAGRAGRYNTHFSEGFATTYKPDDLILLKQILSRPIEPLEAAGLHPTADQIELFAYHLPNATLANLIDIFVSLSQVDEQNYFMCNIESFKFLAEMIQHISLPLRARYLFCCAPINTKFVFVCTMFLKFARQYSNNQPMTLDWLCRNIGWPFTIPKTIEDLSHLEAVFDVLDLYLWFSYRFEDLFSDAVLVRDMQKELDFIILRGVINIIKLLKSTQTTSSYSLDKASDDEFLLKTKQNKKKLIDAATYDEDFAELSKIMANNESPHNAVKANQLNNRKAYKKLNADINMSFAQHLINKGIITQKTLSQIQKELSNKPEFGLNREFSHSIDFKDTTKKGRKK